MANNAITDAIRDSFARTTYTHKTYEKQLEVQYNNLSLYRWIRFIVIAITATGTISVIFTDVNWAKVLTAGFAVLSLFLTLYGLGIKPEEIVSELQRTARDLWFVREKYFHLIADIKSGVISDEDVIRQRDELTKSNYSPIMGIGREGGPNSDRIASKARWPANSAVSMTEAKSA